MGGGEGVNHVGSSEREQPIKSPVCGRSRSQLPIKFHDCRSLKKVNKN
jgi:hypothetical protein